MVFELNTATLHYTRSGVSYSCFAEACIFQHSCLAAEAKKFGSMTSSWEGAMVWQTNQDQKEVHTTFTMRKWDEPYHLVPTGERNEAFDYRISDRGHALQTRQKDAVWM